MQGDADAIWGMLPCLRMILIRLQNSRSSLLLRSADTQCSRASGVAERNKRRCGSSVGSRNTEGARSARRFRSSGRLRRCADKSGIYSRNPAWGAGRSLGDCVPDLSRDRWLDAFKGRQRRFRRSRQICVPLPECDSKRAWGALSSLPDTF